MKAIISAVKGLFDLLSTAWSLITGFLSQLVKFFLYLTRALEISLSFVSTLPTWLRLFGTITISISILYMILGREGGSK